MATNGDIVVAEDITVEVDDGVMAYEIDHGVTAYVVQQRDCWDAERDEHAAESAQREQYFW